MTVQRALIDAGFGDRLATLEKGMDTMLCKDLTEDGVMAATMNELAHQTGLLETDTFNMFFISPYCAPELPVYSMVQQVLPFPLSLGVYVLAFTTAGGLLLQLTGFARKEAKLVSRTLRRAYAS